MSYAWHFHPILCFVCHVVTNLLHHVFLPPLQHALQLETKRCTPYTYKHTKSNAKAHTYTGMHVYTHRHTYTKTHTPNIDTHIDISHTQIHTTQRDTQRYVHATHKHTSTHATHTYITKHTRKYTHINISQTYTHHRYRHTYTTHTRHRELNA